MELEAVDEANNQQVKELEKSLASRLEKQKDDFQATASVHSRELKAHKQALLTAGDI